MSVHSETLHLIAEKLSLGEETDVIRKAAEFDRLLQAKTTIGSVISETSKIVICLDLAAEFLNVDFDSKLTAKCSGLKPLAYKNNRKLLEKCLELNDKINISTLCRTLQCSAVEELADRLLFEYQRLSKQLIDLSLPQYVCMAIYQACRLNKVKIARSKLIERSRLKPSQWGKLEAIWSKFVSENFSSSTIKAKKTSSCQAIVGNCTGEENRDQEGKDFEESIPEIQFELYEEWKKRMLDIAYREQGDLENQMSTRKSLLDTIPCDTVAKAKGVRLLFPVT